MAMYHFRLKSDKKPNFSENFRCQTRSVAYISTVRGLFLTAVTVKIATNLSVILSRRKRVQIHLVDKIFSFIKPAVSA